MYNETRGLVNTTVMNIIVKSGLWIVGITVAVVGLWVLAMIGVSFTTDVTDSKAFWGGYSLNEDYILDRSVFVIKADKYTGGHLVLVPEESFKRCLGRHYSAPDSIDEYRANPDEATIKKYDNFEMKLDVVGVVEKGEMLKLHKLEKNTGWSLWFGGGTSLKPFAQIMSGPFQGEVVDLTDVSIYYREGNDDGPFLYKPEPGVIRSISETKKQVASAIECS